MRYRRGGTGGTYFFTVSLKDRNRMLLVDHVNVLRDVVLDVQERRPFLVEAAVILPNHFHTVWTLPPGDRDFSNRWRMIKSEFLRRLESRNQIKAKRLSMADRRVWQRGAWKQQIRDNKELAQSVDYLHYNPVKHGYVDHVHEWQYSSFHRYVDVGAYPLDWSGMTGVKSGKPYGER